METITLSESAVACLRFRIKGFPLRDRDLPAYRELVEAGIMEPASGTEFCFTPWGMEHREESHDREWKRIERVRHVIPDGVRLSTDARDLLCACILGEPPDGDEATRPAYRELVRANIMMSVGSFTKGDECTFRFTYAGWERRFEFAEIAPSSESA